MITLQFQLKKQKKETNKQSNILTLTVSCYLIGSCLISSKNKKQNKQRKKKIKKLIKMIMEAIIVMIS